MSSVVAGVGRLERGGEEVLGIHCGWRGGGQQKVGIVGGDFGRDG